MIQRLPGQILGYPQAANSPDSAPDTSRASRQAPPFGFSFSLCCITQWLPAERPTCSISSSSQTHVLEKSKNHTLLMPPHCLTTSRTHLYLLTMVAAMYWLLSLCFALVIVILTMIKYEVGWGSPFIHSVNKSLLRSSARKLKIREFEAHSPADV